MEAANRGACDVGAKSVGLNINLPHEQWFRFHYFALRKLHFLLPAKSKARLSGRLWHD